MNKLRNHIINKLHLTIPRISALFMISGLMLVYIVTSIIQYYIFDSHHQCILPYLGVFFPNILLFRIFQEVNNYESLCEYVFTNANWIPFNTFLKMLNSCRDKLVQHVHARRFGLWSSRKFRNDFNIIDAWNCLSHGHGQLHLQHSSRGIWNCQASAVFS